jgi:hypothetical protein
MVGNGQDEPAGLVTVSAQRTTLSSLVGIFHEGIQQTATPLEGAMIAIPVLTRPVLANSSPV